MHLSERMIQQAKRQVRRSINNFGWDDCVELILDPMEVEIKLEADDDLDWLESDWAEDGIRFKNSRITNGHIIAEAELEGEA